MNFCCEDQLWSLSEGELRTLLEVSEESIAQMLGGPCFSAGIDVITLGGGGCRGQDEEGRMNLSSTPVKFLTSAISGGPATLVVLEESPSKRTAGVAFTVLEQQEVFGGICPTEKKE